MTRPRGPNWSEDQTTKLAELRRSSHETGNVMWKRIASTISALFPDQVKESKQCRQRWETLVKGYRKVEDHCWGIRTHTELSEEEIQSLHLSPAYDRELYNIIQEVCGRNPRPAAGMASEPSNTVCPSRNIQNCGESSNQIGTNTVPRSVERESPSHIPQYGAANIAGAMGINQPQDCFGRFGFPTWESDDANQLKSYQNMYDPKISTAIGMLKKPQKLTANEKWAASLIVTPPESKQVETNIVRRESPIHIPRYGAGDLDINQLEAFGAVDVPPLSTTEANDLKSYLSRSNTKISMASGNSSKQVDTNIGQERESSNHISQCGVENIARGLDINQLEAYFEILSWRNIDAESYQSMYEPKNSKASGISKSPDENWYPPEWRTEHETEHETEQVETVTVPMSVDRRSASHIQQYGAANIAGAMGINQPQDDFGIFGLPEWGTDDANRMMYMVQISRASSTSTVMKPEVCFQSSEFIHESDTDSDLESNSCSQGVQSM